MLCAQQCVRGENIVSFLDKAKGAAKDAAEKVEDAAKKAVDMVDEKTGGKVPDAVKDAVDKIDGEVG